MPWPQAGPDGAAGLEAREGGFELGGETGVNCCKSGGNGLGGRGDPIETTAHVGAGENPRGFEDG